MPLLETLPETVENSLRALADEDRRQKTEVRSQKSEDIQGRLNSEF